MRSIKALFLICAGVALWIHACHKNVAARETRTGKASWFGAELKGRTMANGRPFNPEEFVCASYAYPLGTRLLVTTRAKPHRGAIVTVCDRGPARRLGRLLDLSSGAFSKIADLRVGVIDVTVEVLP